MIFSRAASALFVSCIVLCAQDATAPQPKPKSEFEVASIRPSGPRNPGAIDIGLHIDGAQFRCTYFSLSDYISMAYKVKPYQISGPEWLLSDHYDIAAKLPEGAERSQVSDMIKALLADRFKLQFHHESKPLPVNALVIAKGGLKLTPVDPNPSGIPPNEVTVTGNGMRGGFTISYGKDAYFTISENKFLAKNLTMAAIADFLARFVDKPVVDMTETKGTFEFAMEFTPDDFRGMLIHAAISAGVQLPPQALQALQGTSEASLYTALRNVGLNLEARKAPVDILVIDKIEKSPTEN
jgi:uncharacterized protein (TIGR03435 family)